MDPLDSRHFVAASTQLPQGTLPDAPRASLNPVWSYIHVSFDGGATWETQRVAGGPGSTPTDAHGLDSKVGDVVVAFLDGTALLADLGNTRVVLPAPAEKRVQDDNSVYVSRSGDGGRTWPETVVAAKKGCGLDPEVLGTCLLQGDVYHDKEWMVAGPDGTLLLAWTAYTSPGARVMFAVSHDIGLTWSPYRALDEAPGDYNGFAFPLVQRDGTWRIAYHQPSTGLTRLATSADEGASWSLRELGESAHAGHGLGGAPNLREGAHGTRERLWLSYPIPGAVGETEVPAVRWSDDNGSTWSVPLALDGPLPGGTSLLTLDVAADGTAYLAWFHDVNNEKTELRVAAFRGDQAIPPSVVQGNLPGSGGDVGDYFGLAAMPDGAMLLYTAGPGAERDVFAARVVLSR